MKIACVVLGVAILLLVVFAGSVIYDDVGNMFKILARGGAVLGVGISTLYGWLIAGTDPEGALFCVLLGSTCIVVASMAVYAFGQLVDNIDLMRWMMEQDLEGNLGPEQKPEPTMEDFINKRTKKVSE